MSSAIKTPAFQAKAGNIQNEDNSSIYSGGEWSFKNASAVTGFHVTASGNVGIGTTSPSYKLDVAAGYARIARSIGYNASASVGIDLGATNADSVNNSATYAWGQEITGDATGQSLVFKRYRRADSTVEAMRIDASGNLMVGTTNFLANAKLTIKPGMLAYGSANTSDAWLSYFYSVDSTYRLNYNGTGGDEFVLHTNGNYFFSGSNVSDERLKEDIQDVDNQLQNVLALTPKTFRFKAQTQEDGSVGQPGRIQHGFIAQEVKAVIPKLVTGAETNPDEYMGVDYMGLTSILVKAIQEQQAMIEELKAKVSALESK